MSFVINNSTTLDYCNNKAAAEGSNLYYATLFEKEKSKEIIISFHALLQELTDIIHECSDPGIARIKFKWWQEEIERLLNDQPRHPVTQELKKNIIFNSELKNDFNALIENFEQLIFIEQPDSIESCLSLYKTTTGELWYQCAVQLDYSEKNILGSICNMGALSHFLICLQQPNVYLNETRCIIPASYSVQSRLLKLRTNPSIDKSAQTELFTPLILDLKNRLDETYNNFPKKDRGALQHVLILNRLAIKLCEEILRDGCLLLDTKISLTPIRKLWIAWQTHVSITYF